jgi:superfamily II DNA or RNA helicase
MNRTDRSIASCSSWEEFWQRATQLSEAETGRTFERLVQLYLQTAPEYRTSLKDVWLLSEAPPDVREQLRLPRTDEGIDLIARTRRGEYCAIQAKFRSQRDKALTWRELSTFQALAFRTCRRIVQTVIAHTCTKPVGKRQLMPGLIEIGLDRWRACDWSAIVANLKGEPVKLEPRSPRRHQERAIAAARKHFVDDKAARGRLIMPCGTGKSLTAFWIAQALEATTILVAVPSLALIRQSVADWTREFLANGQIPNWLCVCSDESVGKLENDEFVGETYDTGLPTYTDPKEIATRLRPRDKAPNIVFTTYQSSDKLAQAARRAGITFDLAILDEAHKTVGVRSKKFATLLRERNLKARRRLFMTATEKKFVGDNGDSRVLSMDNEADYGNRFFEMSYREAIDQRIISDYKILTITVSDNRVAKIIEDNRILNLNRNLDEAEARSLAAGIAVKQVFEEHGATHGIGFLSSIRKARDFRDQQRALQPDILNFHISSKNTAGERADLLREFENAPRAFMTNARCLTEGVDVPAIDCVAFIDPKHSRIDIVQAAGRALRVSPATGKELGYILLPIIVPDGMSREEFAETTAFRDIERIVGALATQDERIIDEFRAIRQGKIPSGKIVEIIGDVPVGLRMSLDEFSDAISLRIWERVARLNWRSFEEARAFIRSLNLKSFAAWQRYAKSDKRPLDIPQGPHEVYAKKGWLNWSDWLGGTGRTPAGRNFRPFTEARAFVRSLNLKSEKEWLQYCRSGKRPSDIPSTPGNIYADSGWISLADWLGADLDRRDGYRSYKQARAFARSLKFKAVKEWYKYVKSGKKPFDIPASPNQSYADEGWTNWADWLGADLKRRGRGWRPFKEARAFVRRLNLKSSKDWRNYYISGRKPNDIPSGAQAAYKADWISWGDWLGTDSVSTSFRKYRPFKKARAVARGLNLESAIDWKNYCVYRKLRLACSGDAARRGVPVT